MFRTSKRDVLTENKMLEPLHNVFEEEEEVDVRNSQTTKINSGKIKLSLEPRKK